MVLRPYSTAARVWVSINLYSHQSTTSSVCLEEPTTVLRRECSADLGILDLLGPVRPGWLSQRLNCLALSGWFEGQSAADHQNPRSKHGPKRRPLSATAFFGVALLRLGFKAPSNTHAFLATSQQRGLGLQHFGRPATVCYCDSWGWQLGATSISQPTFLSINMLRVVFRSRLMCWIYIQPFLQDDMLSPHQIDHRTQPSFKPHRMHEI